jgi:hypothetical protein
MTPQERLDALLRQYPSEDPLYVCVGRADLERMVAGCDQDMIAAYDRGLRGGYELALVQSIEILDRQVQSEQKMAKSARVESQAYAARARGTAAARNRLAERLAEQRSATAEAIKP